MSEKYSYSQRSPERKKRTPLNTAVHNYRKSAHPIDELGQDVIIETILGIEESSNDKYMDNDPNQPYALDKACMYMELARAQKDYDNRKKARSYASKSLNALLKSSDVTFSARVDASTYLSDLKFENQLDEFKEGMLDKVQYKSSFVLAHLEEINDLHNLVVQHRNTDGFSAGKLFEKWWIISNRNILLEQDGIRDRFVRSAYTREDRSHIKTASGKSCNYDAVEESLDNSGWRIIKKEQLGIGASKDEKYLPEIDVRQLVVDENYRELVDNIAEWSNVLQGEIINKYLDPSVEITPHARRILEEMRKTMSPLIFIES